MFDPKTLYGLNKEDKDAIVYTDAGGNIIRLTREDFATEGEFLMWKRWSDKNFHKEEKRDHLYSDNTVYLNDLPAGVVSAPAPDVLIEHRIEKRATERYAVETVIHIRGRLTKRQFRRLWLYCLKGMTEQSIADAEGKTQQDISKSLIAAKKKIFRLLLPNRAK